MQPEQRLGLPELNRRLEMPKLIEGVLRMLSAATAPRTTTAAVHIDQIHRLVDLAATAPSGDNLQPWCFVWKPFASRLLLQVHPTRDLTIMNAGFRMARIACGAALENIHQAVGHVGLAIQHEKFLSEDSVELRLVATDRQETDEARIAAIRDRVTNRKEYDRCALPELLRGRLDDFIAANRAFPIKLKFIHDEAIRPELDRTLAAIEGVTFALKEMRECLVEQVRFGPADSEACAQGLPIDTLELKRLDRWFLGWLGAYPEWAMRSILKRQSENYPLTRLRSSAALALITAPRHLRNADFLTGRMFQRTWLRLTEMGLSVQPMMSAVGLHTFYRSGAEDLLARLNRWGAPQLLARLNQLTGLDDPSMEIAGIVRLGMAEPPSARTRRLHLDNLLTVL